MLGSTTTCAFLSMLVVVAVAGCRGVLTSEGTNVRCV